jgi:uncharacterized cupredoxin-like copper-binding protein
MATKERPNVTGKGPALAKEIIGIFNEIVSNGGSMQAACESELAERGAELQKIGKMAYLKTVKAGELTWDLKEMSLELKSAVHAGEEAKAKELLETVTKEMDHLIHKIKTFVVRMT